MVSTIAWSHEDLCDVFAAVREKAHTAHQLFLKAARSVLQSGTAQEARYICSDLS